MVNRILHNAVVAALRSDDGRRPPIELGNVVHMVVGDFVAPVDIFGSRSVAGQQDPHAPQFCELATDNAVILRVQVKSDTGAAGAYEAATLHGAVFAATETYQRTGTIESLPIMLDAPAGAATPRVTVALRESQPTENQAANRRVVRPGIVDVPLHTDQFRQQGNCNVVAGALAFRPEVQRGGLRVEHPLAWLVQDFERVFDARGTLQLDHRRSAKWVRSRCQRSQHALLGIHRLDGKDIHDPGEHGNHQELGVGHP